MIRLLPRLLWRLRGFFWNMLRIFLSPERAHRVYQREVEALESKLLENVDYSLPFEDFRQTYFASDMTNVLNVSMSALMASPVRNSRNCAAMSGRSAARCRSETKSVANAERPSVSRRR